MSEQGRILAVDDTPSTLEMLQRNLMSQGYQVFTAPGVTAAIRMIED
jgi:DNA-binding response OmpR family regulator